MLYEHTPCPVGGVVDVNEEATAVPMLYKHTPCPVGGVVDVNEELFRVGIPGGRQGSQGQVDVLNSLKKVKDNSTLHSYPHKQSEVWKLGYLYDA